LTLQYLTQPEDVTTMRVIRREFGFKVTVRDFATVEVEVIGTVGDPAIARYLRDNIKWRLEDAMKRLRGSGIPESGLSAAGVIIPEIDR